MAQTRRLAAILAADVVGYSRLMGEDEAGTAKAVREHCGGKGPSGQQERWLAYEAYRIKPSTPGEMAHLRRRTVKDSKASHRRRATLRFPGAALTIHSKP
jgi:hypothetical protein